MKALRVFRLALVAAAIAGVGCAEQPQVTIFGNLAYEGADADTTFAVPADADPQVSECLGNSTTQGSDGRGIKTDEQITAPYFIGLWPAATETRPENHGRLDVPSVGAPLPGDHPFTKHIVCTLGVGQNFDWTIEESFVGKYYVGAWLDRDMNGYPGKGEPLGYYSGEGTAPATISFLKEPKQEVDIIIGGLTVNFDEQVETLKENLERALDKFDEELFAAQFQPLLFKDPFGHTINQIDVVYNRLTDSTNRDATVIDWGNKTPPAQSGSGGIGTVVVAQDKNPNAYDLNQHVEYKYGVQVASGSDGIYQISDWKPLWEQSGSLTIAGSPPTEFSPNANIEFTVNVPAAMDIWVALERFWASTTAPSGGTWSTLPSIPTPATWATISQGEKTFEFGPLQRKATNLGFGDIELNTPDVWDTATMMRVSFIPVGDGGYDYPSNPADVTEPTRGNYLRFYVYGSQFVYRKQPSK